MAEPAESIEASALPQVGDADVVIGNAAAAQFDIDEITYADCGRTLVRVSASDRGTSVENLVGATKELVSGFAYRDPATAGVISGAVTFEVDARGDTDNDGIPDWWLRSSKVSGSVPSSTSS